MPNAEQRYVRHSSGVEVKQPNEDEDIQSCLEVLKRMQARADEKYRYALRGAHAKSHGLLKGELKIYENLPEESRRGIAKTPTTYPIVIRLSTSPPDIYHDGSRRSRVCDQAHRRAGKKLHPEPNAHDAVTQDSSWPTARNSDPRRPRISETSPHGRQAHNMPRLVASGRRLGCAPSRRRNEPSARTLSAGMPAKRFRYRHLATRSTRRPPCASAITSQS